VVLKIVFSLVLLLAILNTSVHFVAFELGIFGLSQEGVSGFAVGGLPVGEAVQEGYPVDAFFSRLIVIGEWALVIVFAMIFFIQGRKTFKKNLKELEAMKNAKRKRHHTDLDVLHGMLKKKGRIGFKSISKVFNIDEDLVREWSDTLVEGNLARVKYPRIGDAELVSR